MPYSNDGSRRGPDLEQIESNIIDIERGTLRAGPVSFQISNIASLRVDPPEVLPGTLDAFDIWEAIKGVFVGLSLAFVGLFVAAIVGSFNSFYGGIIAVVATVAAIWFVVHIVREMVMSAKSATFPAQLVILTNAASSFQISDNDMGFLVRLKSVIEDAMRARAQETIP
jgi:hypothetical protein